MNENDTTPIDETYRLKAPPEMAVFSIGGFILLAVGILAGYVPITVIGGITIVCMFIPLLAIELKNYYKYRY